jgi:protease II
VTSLAWAADSRTLFYSRSTRPPSAATACTADARRPRRSRVRGARRALRHQRGRDAQRGFVRARITSKDTSEMRVLPSARPAGRVPRRRAAPRGREYYVDHHGERFSSAPTTRAQLPPGARARGRSRRAQLEAGGRAPPAGDARGDRPLPRLLGAGRARQGAAQAARHRFRDRRAHYIAFDEAVYSAHPSVNGSTTPAVPLRLREPGHAAVVVRLRRAKRTSSCSSASRCSGGYDPADVRLRGAHRGREGRRAHPDLDRLPQVAARTGRSRCCSTATARTASRWIRTSRRRASRCSTGE